jgi:hypothetical protein
LGEVWKCKDRREDATIACERLGFENYTEKAAKPLSYGLIIIL